MTSDETTGKPPLQGKTILITGAGDGLGAALARRAGSEGAEVILLGRTVRKLEAVYDDIVTAGGPDPAIVPLDLEGATPDDYADIAERIETQCGSLDGLIHNAALLGKLTPLVQYPPLDWMRAMQINLNAPMLLTQACYPLLIQASQPALVFIGDAPRRAYWGAYGVTKAGLQALAETLAGELAGSKPIGVHWIVPGPMQTNFRVHAYPAAAIEEAAAPDGEPADRVLAALHDPLAANSRIMPKG